MKAIFIFVGSVLGLLVVRGFMLDPIEEMAWRIFWHKLFEGNVGAIGIEKVFTSATFIKSLVGVLVGGTLGYIYGGRVFGTKTGQSDGNPASTDNQSSSSTRLAFDRYILDCTVGAIQKRGRDIAQALQIARRGEHLSQYLRNVRDNTIWAKGAHSRWMITGLCLIFVLLIGVKANNTLDNTNSTQTADPVTQELITGSIDFAKTAQFWTMMRSVNALGNILGEKPYKEDPVEVVEYRMGTVDADVADNDSVKLPARIPAIHAVVKFGFMNKKLVEKRTIYLEVSRARDKDLDMWRCQAMQEIVKHKVGDLDSLKDSGPSKMLSKCGFVAQHQGVATDAEHISKWSAENQGRNLPAGTAHKAEQDTAESVQQAEQLKVKQEANAQAIVDKTLEGMDIDRILENENAKWQGEIERSQKAQAVSKMRKDLTEQGLDPSQIQERLDAAAANQQSEQARNPGATPYADRTASSDSDDAIEPVLTTEDMRKSIVIDNFKVYKKVSDGAMSVQGSCGVFLVSVNGVEASGRSIGFGVSEGIEIYGSKGKYRFDTGGDIYKESTGKSSYHLGGLFHRIVCADTKAGKLIAIESYEDMGFANEQEPHNYIINADDGKLLTQSCDESCLTQYISGGTPGTDHTDANSASPADGNHLRNLSPGNAATNTLIDEMIAMSIENNNEKLAELRDLILAQPKPPRGDRKSARQLNDRGLGYFKAERYAEAAQAFQQATQLDPSDVEIVNNIGYALLEAGRLQEASEALTKALLMAPNRTGAWTNLGQTYAMMGQKQQAIACFTNAYRFSKNADKTKEFLTKLAQSDSDQNVRDVAAQALTLM